MNAVHSGSRDDAQRTRAEALSRLTEQLRVVVAEAYGDPAVKIRSVHQLTGGASRETWSFDAHRGDGTIAPLILRRDPPNAIRGMAVEALALRAALAAGVPEPVVLAHSDDPVHVDAPFVLMERLDGEALARRILRDAIYDDVRPRLAAQCGEILARIHSIPTDPFTAAGVPCEDQVDALRADLDGFDEPRPVLELGLRWLERHRPPENPPTVVHGDFRHGNLLIAPTGITGVLDWEQMHIGDPMEDLGYLCVRAWRFGGPGPVGGFGSYDELFGAYEAAGGRAVDPEVVRWWEVVGTLRWGVGCLQQGSRHLSGAERGIELAAIGRRTVEQEYDVLLLIEDRLGDL